MGKAKGKLGGRNSNKGSKAYSQRVVVNDGQFTKANSIIVLNSFSLKAEENTYSSKHNIHTRIDGRVRIKDGKVKVEE